MAIDACAFIKPAFFHGGIHPNRDSIILAVIQVGGDVITKARVSAGLPAQVMAVDPDHRIPEDAVEFHADAPTQIGFGNGKDLAVPADTGFGKFPAQRLVAVTVAAVGVKGKFDCPVVRQVDLTPNNVVIIGCRRAVTITGLGQI